MIPNPRTLLIWDGIGAFLSTILLGGILPLIQPFIGLPAHLLYLFGSLACLYTLYDLACLQWANLNHPRFLIGIALANGCHCILTLGFLFKYSPQITLWGWIYFIGEILIVCGLIFLETRTIRHLIK